MIVSEFHKKYHNSGVWYTGTTWMGVHVQKCPLDLWAYQDILFELKPDLIIETGTAFGGSALFMAHICDIIGNGSILSIDIAQNNRPVHNRITYLLGSSIDRAIIDIAKCTATNLTTMVILDSCHTREHVLQEMVEYSKLVTVGSYIIVEDTNINGHPVCEDHGPGPFEAVSDFLVTNKDFQIDLSREKFMMTQNPGGYLKRVQ